MSNYNNIKPYNEFNHVAATRGGVDKYISELKKASYNSGRADEIGELIWKIPLASAVGIGLWEAGKACVRKIKDHHRAKKETIEMQLKKAEETVREKMNTSDNEEGSREEI